MFGIRSVPLPPHALLASYTNSGSYTDCYSVRVDRPVSLSEFMEAFYTTRIFKLERWLLASTLRLASTDDEAKLLARGEVEQFSAWQVETRQVEQVVLAAARTRSWLMVAPFDQCTTLFFGSAIVPHQNGGLGWQFTMLLSFHKVYSRVLLRAAAKNLRALCVRQ